MEKVFKAVMDWKYLDGEEQVWGEEVVVKANSRTDAYNKLREIFPYDRSKKQPGIFVSKRPIKLFE